MALEFSQLYQRRKRELLPLDEFEQANVTKVVRGNSRQKKQTHVGGRRTMRDHRERILLKIVGRQPVIFRADEGFKKAPGATRDIPCQAQIVREQLRAALDQSLADKTRDERR